MGLDGRIGPRFLHAGIGYGGSCFPKDIKALLVTAKDYDVDMSIVSATDKINHRSHALVLQRR
jgi:UDPglucose 6-dehydrogenase